jgi:superfamily II DNA/RNA helicase
MFDPDTVALIARAPTLEGLDLNALPQRFTDAYASIVAARIRLRQIAGNREGLAGMAADTINEMRRLAFSLEALVSLLPDREDRAAAGFVAGTAHHVTILAERLASPISRPSTLTADGISPEVSATLLFLVAEAVADAAEMAKAIAVQTDDPVEHALLDAIRHLADGRLAQLLNTEVPAIERLPVTTRPVQAVRSLYFMLLHGVRGMAATMLDRDAETATRPYTADFRDLFRQVRALCTESIDDLFEDGELAASSLFPGPAHMASLLLAVSQDLPSNALARLPPPNDIDQQRWSELMRSIAEKRPYLWRNHRQAIEAGYLERRVSSVISFPTGAGKSTLAELKIAGALLRGEKVVFLAPTLALVEQTARALAKVFPKAKVQRERTEEVLLDIEAEELPAISVMTPERCLMLLSFNSGAFEGVGLLVFDECHLLHPREPFNSRRAIDAMLCVLNFVTIVPGADLLFLSAMMSNASVLAKWLEHLTERPALALELTWKPTRQVRGCVVYSTEQVEALQRRLRLVRASADTKNVPAAVKRELSAQPFGFFCLRQTWSARREDFALLPLLDDSILLSTGTAKDQSWYLTPNGNQVAASLAAASAAQRLKTLTFTQTIPLANAAVKRISEDLGSSDIAMTEDELRNYEAAREELGDERHLYIETSAERHITSSAAAHHGLLLPAERNLHESLFRRRDGIHALVATSTLAQGMNLPSEVVLIAGDSRFDPDANRLQQLEAHELLNAAGRAGRAGEGSYGFVLVVPSKVVHFDNSTSRIARHWADLQAIFSQSDQCIAIEDPLVPLLDQIHAAAEPLSAAAHYLLRRLPTGGVGQDDDQDGPARNLLRRSFGAFLAAIRNDEVWVHSRIDAVLAFRRADPDAGEALTWVERLAAAAGVSVTVVRNIRDWLNGHPVADGATVLDWREAVFDWLEQRPDLIPLLLRREGLEGLFGTNYRRLERDEDRGRHALPGLRRLCREWMSGNTLAAMERSFGTPVKRLAKCEAAREFVLRVVPELAYLYGLCSQVARALAAEGGPQTGSYNSISVEVLASCVREGFDQPEKLALRIAKGHGLSRVMVHREFAQIAYVIERPAESENFGALLRRVKRAVDTVERPDDD